VHARVEDCIRTGKDTGLAKFPSQAFALNQAWLPPLPAGWLAARPRLPLARAEPETLRHRLLHAGCQDHKCRDRDTTCRADHLRHEKWPESLMTGRCDLMGYGQ
jgi:hypothetical protein